MGVDTIKEKENMKPISRKIFKCPFCGLLIEIDVDHTSFTRCMNENHFLYPHLHVHGRPLHGALCYLDPNMAIRNIEIIRSIEIFRSSDIFQQLLNKWLNQL